MDNPNIRRMDLNIVFAGIMTIIFTAMTSSIIATETLECNKDYRDTMGLLGTFVGIIVGSLCGVFTYTRYKDLFIIYFSTEVINDQNQV